MTSKTHLEKLTAKELGQMAKNRGVVGWYSMNKADLIDNILAVSVNHSFMRTSSNHPETTATHFSGDTNVQNDKTVKKSKTGLSDSLLSCQEEETNEEGKQPACASQDKSGKNVKAADASRKTPASLPKSKMQTSLGRTNLDAAKLENEHANDSSVMASSSENSSRHTISRVPLRSSGIQPASPRSSSANANLSGSMTPAPGTPGTLGLPPASSMKPIPRRANLVDLNSVSAQKSNRDREFAGSMKEDKDRLVIMVRDAYWLHIHWNIRQRTRERVRASMGRDWHYAQPVIRLFEISTSNGLQARKNLKDVVIEPKSGNWFINVDGKPNCYQVEIGYLSEKEKFYSVLSSNIVLTPEASTARGFGLGNSGDSSETDAAVTIAGIRVQKETRPYDSHEDVFRRIISPLYPSARNTGLMTLSAEEFPFSIDAKVLLHGRTLPGAHITVRGYPVIVDEDGEFLMRMELPDKRQVIPIVASSGDGTQQRTIVLSLERNTRILEPVFCDMEEL